MSESRIKSSARKAKKRWAKYRWLTSRAVQPIADRSSIYLHRVCQALLQHEKLFYFTGQEKRSLEHLVNHGWPHLDFTLNYFSHNFEFLLKEKLPAVYESIQS